VDKDIDKIMLTAQANMMAQGLVTQDNDGLLNFTPKGLKRVEKLLDDMSEEDFALITGYFKVIIAESNRGQYDKD
jgi:hypothetical protein